MFRLLIYTLIYIVINIHNVMFISYSVNGVTHVCLLFISAPANEALMGIKINDKKKKLMELFSLYEAKMLNSSELFES